MWVEVCEPLHVRLHHGEERLERGRTIYLPELQALKLLSKANGKVHLVRLPKCDQIGLMQHAKVYWRTEGRCKGPVAVHAVVETDGGLWVLVIYRGQVTWIHEGRIVTAQTMKKGGERHEGQSD